MMPMTIAEAVAKGHGTERPVLCPVHEDTRPSASLNIIKKVFYCYTCGAHGHLDGEAALAEPDYQQLKRWYEENLEEPRVYPESWLACFTAGPSHGYWSRVGARAVHHFKLGDDPRRGAVTYPLRRTDGAVLGVVRRHIDQDPTRPKYLYPRGIDIGQLLFNYAPDARRDVVLVEGAIDAIALWNVGVEAFAIYGARLSETQINLIDRVDPERIWTCFDLDEAGRAAHQQVAQAFRHRVVTRLTWPRTWGKDIDEIGLDHRVEILPDCLQNRKIRVGSTCG